MFGFDGVIVGANPGKVKTELRHRSQILMATKGLPLDVKCHFLE